MHGVVAMQRITSCPVAEAEKELDPFVLPQLHYVFPGDLVVNGRLFAVASEDLMFLQMNVNGMGPITREVCQHPVLSGVLLDREANAVAIHEGAVDRPLSVEPVKTEVAYDCGLLRGARQVVAPEETGLDTVVIRTVVVHVKSQN